MDTAPIRILWLIKGLGPGGAEQLLVSSARVADHQRFRFSTAFVRPDKTRLVPRLEAEGVSCTLIGAGRWGQYVWPIRMRRLMRRADLVHAHSPLLAGVARLLALTIPRSERPIMVSTEHNMWPRFGRLTRWLNALTAPLDAQRWAVSREVRESMWPSRRAGAEVLIHGIVTEEAPPSATRERLRAELEVPPNAVVGITVGNYRRQKDYPNLLRAARQALDANPELVFWAVGQGPLEREVFALHAELGLGDRFRLLGYRADVAELLTAADFFCLGSEHEGLPVAVMEAMAASLPVVATRVGGVGEAVTEGVSGLLVPRHDAAALATGLLAMAADGPERARMGAAAKQSSARFDIRNAMTVQQDRYQALVSERGRLSA
ncbi:MAG: glycosyltransferase [Micropruina sp.]